MINPYSAVDWSSAKQIMTCTHDHVIDSNVSTTTKTHFDNLYNGGVRCFAISNYYPSKPMYPLSDYTDEIGEVPDDIIEVPNAEQHHIAVNGMFGNSIHMNSIGSMFESGHERGVSPVGYSGKVEDLIEDALAELLYADGGGLTLNHPTWTNEQNLFSFDLFMSILDMDDRVLGIEAFSGYTWDTEIWDRILLTGRRCWGFAGPDHKHKSNATWYGRMMLVVPELTQHECLRAFRNGNSYVKWFNTDLLFSRISLEETTLRAETSVPCTIRFVADGYTAAEYEATSSAVFNCENVLSYVRVEAETETDKLCSQPIMFYVREKHKRIPKKLYMLGV